MPDTPSEFDRRFNELSPAQQELVYLCLCDLMETRLIARIRRSIEGREQRPLQTPTRVEAVIQLN